MLSLMDENTAAALLFAVDNVYDKPTNVVFYNLGASSLQVKRRHPLHSPPFTPLLRPARWRGTEPDRPEQGSLTSICYSLRIHTTQGGG